MDAKAMVVAGVMSGTSADGIDVAVCRISPAKGASGAPRIKLLGHLGVPYSKALRSAVMGAMDAQSTSVAELARLNWRLGEAYADAVEKAQTKFGVKVGLVGCHGQTIYHQGVPTRYAGKLIRSTWQTGEPSVIAERMNVPIVSDFRSADMAAGGQGAPLVPILDLCMFGSAKVSRVLQNLGGIANLTAIPAGASAENVIAFDTGPANMVIDACMRRLFQKEFDKGGTVGRRGRVLPGVVARVLADGYFSAPPPKSCGREQFGEAFVGRFIALCRKASSDVRDEDVIATATELTSASIVDAYRRFVWPHMGQFAPLADTEFVVAGGGARNAALMEGLRGGLEPLGVKVRLMEDLGIPAQAKEAVAFALLAWLRWWSLPGNIPAATGARRPAVLGKVTHG